MSLVSRLARVSMQILATLLMAAVSSALVTRGSAADASGRLVIATSEHGAYYFHGTLVPAPYSIAVGYTIDSGDTLWDGIYINDIPMHPQPVRHPLSARDSLEKLREEAIWTAARGAAIPPATPPAQRVRLLGAAYSRIPGLVDSARALSDTQVVIYWAGSTRPDFRTFTGQLTASPAEGSKVLLREARRWGSYLAVQTAILTTSAGELIVPASRVPELNAEIADARKGVDRKYSMLREPRQVAEFRNPKPLPSRKD